MTATLTDAAYSRDLQFLTGVNLFTGLTPAELCQLGPPFKKRSYKRGEVIYHEDDPAGNLFVVTKGLVKIHISGHSGKNVTIAWTPPGSVFGTISLVDEHPRPEAAVALEPTEVIILGAEECRAFLRSHPEVALRFLEMLAVRWRSTMRLLHDVAFLDIAARLAKVLLEPSGRMRLPGPDETEPVTRLNQAEVASLVCTTRESVNRWLKFFDRQGWIEFKRGRIRVLQPAKLAELLE